MTKTGVALLRSQARLSVVASYADALWTRHAIFLSHELLLLLFVLADVPGGGRLRDAPKERLVGARLRLSRLHRSCCSSYDSLQNKWIKARTHGATLRAILCAMLQK